jgi:hypothetical protein
MRHDKLLILIDSIINLFLGIVLLAYSDTVVEFFGLPVTDQYFYPSILGAILFGIGIALLIEYTRKNEFIGLGLGGAITINMLGGIVLFFWLIWGSLNIPIHGTIILWVLDFILVGISAFELLTYLKERQSNQNALR